MSTRPITPDNARAFLSRPWAELEDLKRERWSRALRRDPTIAARASEELADFMRGVGDALQAPEARRADFESHVRLRALLERAGAYLGRDGGLEWSDEEEIHATKKKAKKPAVTRLVHERSREKERPSRRPSPLATTFAALARAFAKAGVRWYVFGAQAAIFYGVARATADIDVTVDLGAMRPSDLVKALASEGFDPVTASPSARRSTSGACASS